MDSQSQVFYRAWRPKRFVDLVGQEHVVVTLKRAVTTGQVSHAYLFTGPRGVGKTSTARILGKALNCLNLTQGEPDGSCINCYNITIGRFLDFIEIDAASNRSVESIENLIEKVNFRPVSSSRKIYVIDEAHMLTEAAFNALLKTLEEPPDHVVFILATTDVHKLPPTIISRCQRYDFRRIAQQDTISRLQEIASVQGFALEDNAAMSIANAAFGSLRDAENILEQLSVFTDNDDQTSQNTITQDTVVELLGLGHTTVSIDLAVALLKSDIYESFSIINQCADKGLNLDALRKSTLEALRCAMLIKYGVTTALGQTPQMVERLSPVAENTHIDTIINLITAMGEVTLNRYLASPILIEIAVIKALTYKPQQHKSDTQLPSKSYTQTVDYQHTSTVKPSTHDTNRVNQPSTHSTDWGKVMLKLKEQGGNADIIRALLTNIMPPQVQNGKIELRFNRRAIMHNFTKRMNNNIPLQEIFRSIVDSVYGKNLTFSAVLVSDVSSEQKNGSNEELGTVKFLKGMGAIEVNNQYRRL